ncbi:unnamed protein product, partial [Amoebophrya sp. A120]|eukprot:GSA120T00021621001.1
MGNNLPKYAQSYVTEQVSDQFGLPFNPWDGRGSFFGKAGGSPPPDQARPSSKEM